MQIVTIISDWKNDSLYKSQIKGKLLSTSSNINIVDLISEVVSFDIVDAAFIFKNSYKNFPANTIHFNFIDNQRIDNQDFIIVKHNKQYFVSRDNGFLSLVLPKNDLEVFRIPSNVSSFEELSVSSTILDAIIYKKLEKISVRTDNFKRTIILTPSISDFQIIGHIIYIDSYGNLITDVSKDDFFSFVKNYEFKIYFKTDRSFIDIISDHYSDVDHGELLAIFNSFGLLELAQRNGDIAEMFGVKKHSEIRIERIIKDEDKNLGTLF